MKPPTPCQFQSKNQNPTIPHKQMTITLGIRGSSSSTPHQPKEPPPNQIPLFAMFAHIIHMIIDHDPRSRQLIPLHNRHIMISIAQIITLPPHKLPIHLPIPLLPHHTHIPLLPIKPNPIIHPTPPNPIRIMRPITKPIRQHLIPMLI